jgi:hypothetical protein
MGAVGGGNYENRTVHLGGTGDHVLHIVGVSRTVNVRIVALIGLVLEVPGVDGDTTGLFLGCVVDLVVIQSLRTVLVCTVHCDGSTQRRLTMVDVTDGSDVNMRLRSFELFLSHYALLTES